MTNPDEDENSEAKRLGESIGRELERTGLSQAELARRMNVARSAVCEWVKGVREPSLKQLREMAAAFGREFTGEFTERAPECVAS